MIHLLGLKFSVTAILCGKDKNYFRQLSKIWNYFLDLRVTLCNFGFAELTMHSEMKRKTSFPFAFLSFFRNFARILSFSLYKGSLGD